jgi:hypothetical protein
MSTAPHPQSEMVFAGSHCHCLRPPPPGPHPRYVLVAHADQSVVGELRWHAGWRKYVLVAKPGTAWPNTTLG